MVSLCVCWGWGTVRPGGGVTGAGRVSYPLAGMRDGGWLFLQKEVSGKTIGHREMFFQSEEAEVSIVEGVSST